MSLSGTGPFARWALGLAALVSTSLFTARPAHADFASCIAASEQALTLRRSGRLQAARGELAKCAVAGCPEEVRTDCGKRMEAVNAAMPSLVVGAKDAGGNDLVAADLAVDGVSIATSLDGRPVEVDPGEHVVRVTAPGLAPAERKVVVGEGEKTRHETFVLGAAVVPTVAAPAERPLEEQGGHGLGARRWIAVGSGAGGLVGVGLGATFGLLASSAWSSAKGAVTSQASCASAAACPAHSAAESDHSSAETFATASTVAFAVGAGLVATGVVLWFTAPAQGPVAKAGRLRVVPAGAARVGMLTLQGAF